MMEHVVCSQIMKHLDHNNILVQHQHGFRCYSCETQLICVIGDLVRSMNAGEQIDLLILEFSKALDKVPHERLLMKPHYYGLPGQLQHWIRTLLTQRCQRVVADGQHSEYTCTYVRSGVP